MRARHDSLHAGLRSRLPTMCLAAVQGQRPLPSLPGPFGASRVLQQLHAGVEHDGIFETKDLASWTALMQVIPTPGAQHAAGCGLQLPANIQSKCKGCKRPCSVRPNRPRLRRTPFKATSSNSPKHSVAARTAGSVRRALFPCPCVARGMAARVYHTHTRNHKDRATHKDFLLDSVALQE
jgi:hypothetical protein